MKQTNYTLMMFKHHHNENKQNTEWNSKQNTEWNSNLQMYKLVLSEENIITYMYN